VGPNSGHRKDPEHKDGFRDQRQSVGEGQREGVSEIRGSQVGRVRGRGGYVANGMKKRGLVRKTSLLFM